MRFSAEKGIKMSRKKPKDMSFANFAPSYDSGIAGKGSRKFYDLLLRVIELHSGSSVLDVGCGTGTLLTMISKKYEISGYGIDTEPNMIDAAVKNCPQMRFFVGGCDKLQFDDSIFDAVIACMAYHHFDKKEEFAREAARVLKPGGILYIVDPRFPWVIRKTINGILRLVRVVGEFYTPDEIKDRFAEHGFICNGAVTDSYAQVVKLQRKQE